MKIETIASLSMNEYKKKKSVGKLIVFCGIDGSGKSSHSRRLRQRLADQEINSKRMRLVTSGSSFFKQLDDAKYHMPRQTFCDVIAFHRFNMIKTKLQKELMQADFVICDRYLFSDYAYTKAHGCEPSFALKLIELAHVPDLVFLCDVSPQEAMKRIACRKKIWQFQENLELLSSANKVYKELVQEFGLITIDTQKPITQIEEFIWQVMCRRFEIRSL